MINFDSLSLSVLVEELYPVLIGCRVQRVQQPSKYEIILTVRSEGKNRKLCISAHPKYSYISLLDHSKRTFHNPQNPPMFCMLLRKHMAGAKIVDIKQPENERILEIFFESFNELGDRILMTLACEIMGKYSNIILYITSSKLILGCAHNVGETMSSTRELAGSLPYVLLPAQNKLNILNISCNEFVTMSKALNIPFDMWLIKTFHYISLALAREFCKISNVNTSHEHSNLNKIEDIKNLYNNIFMFLEKRDFKPSISEDMNFYSLLAKDPEIKWKSFSSVNEMLDRYFAYHIESDSFKQMQTNLKFKLKRNIKKLNQKIEVYNEALNKAEKAEDYKHKGEIITANLHSLDKGKNEVILNDFYNDYKPITIELDPLLTPNQNAQKYFKLYNKAKNSIQITKDRKKQEEARIDYLNSILLSINQSTDINSLDEINEELNLNLINIKKQKIKPQKTKTNIALTTFISQDNFEILVGRNNKQNDYLISKIAHHKDIWFHVKLAHGSHVIIKTDRGNKEVPETTINEAALLAGYYSEGRLSSSVPVIYTLKKFVKKPTGANPGFVVYSNEKTLYVNPLEEHMAPILSRIKE